MSETTLILILGLIALFIFRKPINRMTDHLDNQITAKITEDECELITEVNESYEDLIEQNGEDFQSVQQIYKKLHRRGGKKKNS